MTDEQHGRYVELMNDRAVWDMKAVAEALAVKYQTVRMWRTEGVLPDPDVPVQPPHTPKPLWRAGTVRRWAVLTGRMSTAGTPMLKPPPGRPRKAPVQPPPTPTRGPAVEPCETCPYRLDVPSGVWTVQEYAKLPQYDADTALQPAGVFLCHRHNGRVCAGWAGCHDGDELLAVRFAGFTPTLTVEVAQEIRDYVSPVPLHPSGMAAAAYGMTDVAQPGPAARRAIDKLTASRARRARREQGGRVAGDG